MGSAAAVQVLEYLIAGGVTKIISVGSCGVLEDIPENRFLIPVSALRDEGTSYHYLPPSREVEISKAGINAIESALSQKNIPYWEVKTWTTDGFYRETLEMVQRYAHLAPQHLHKNAVLLDFDVTNSAQLKN